MNEQPIENKKNNLVSETVRTLIIAALLAITFRSFLFEPFHIPSGSMKSNLLVGDYLFVSKYAYGYSRYSFPFSLPLFAGRVMEEEPKRGDVVVFRLPRNPRIDYIKRLIGLPGDNIQVRDGIVYVNGVALPRERVDDYEDDEIPGKVKAIPRFTEKLPEGKTITILKEYRYGAADDTQIYIVPEGHYFFMGDNRDNSRDSRFLSEVGFVPKENLIGRAEFIFLSTKGSLLNPLEWRLERFFTVIP
jgi:signal peptidase I